MNDFTLIPVSSAPTLVRIAIKQQYPNAKYYIRKGRRYFALIDGEYTPVNMSILKKISAGLKLAGEWRQ